DHLKSSGLSAIRIHRGPQAKHIFSHIEWHMVAWEIELDPFESREANPIVSEQTAEGSRSKVHETGFYYDGPKKISLPTDPNRADLLWIEPDGLDEITLPTAFRIYRQRAKELR
ncbi:MAG: hypothetical protein Q4A75_09565, partial [Peptostreptococcaceae bacterium]|nr:hypothetical protein [Peptostreptococcaceae bacterium]